MATKPYITKENNLINEPSSWLGFRPWQILAIFLFDFVIAFVGFKFMGVIAGIIVIGIASILTMVLLLMVSKQREPMDTNVIKELYRGKKYPKEIYDEGLDLKILKRNIE